jgi:general secretion pathway protein C
VKWLAVAAAVVVTGGASLLWIVARDAPEPRHPVPPVATRAPPAPHVAAAAPQVAQPITGVTLHGVVLRGTQSQAILSVDGGPQQAYGIGDVVKGGWSLRAIRDQQVVLANGDASASLGVDAARPAAAGNQGAVAPVVATAASARPSGLAAGIPAPMDDAAAHERNRRFLDIVRAKTHATP